MTARPLPSLKRRGGCGINKKARSHRSAAAGVVAHKLPLNDHPGRANKERDNFLRGAATPPFQGGNCLGLQPLQPARWSDCADRDSRLIMRRNFLQEADEWANFRT